MDDEKPSTSKQIRSSIAELELDDDDLTLAVKDDEAEIDRLELSADLDKEKTLETEKLPAPDDERIPKITFNCQSCDMKEKVHYYGMDPPFVYGLSYLEDTYVMRDPFKPPPPRWKRNAEYFIALGAKCVICQRTVCKDSACSIFYTNTFCLDCAVKMGDRFPAEVCTKVHKLISAKKAAT